MKHNQSNFLPGIFSSEHRVDDNHLFYGDNLTIMRQMPPMSIDLIYLDPPFNSQRNYNLIYKKLTGQPVPEQEEAFCDAWEMDAEKEEMVRNMPIAFEEYGADQELVLFWQTWITALRRTQPRLLAYLVYMSYRLFEMKRILKRTGSIYLHCDPTASHYIKVIMDGIFGHQNFRSEIIWKRTSAHSSAKRPGPIHDVLLFYTNSDNYVWNPIYQPYSKEYVDTFFDQIDEHGRKYKRSDLTGGGTSQGESGKVWRNIDVNAKGRHWMYVPEKLDELDALGKIHWPKAAGGMPRLKQYPEDLPGIPLQDIWDDIKPLHNLSKERLGYPTQKPRKLLERIINSSSNPGDIVFDPFAGCGTAIYAAHLLGRKWIGCDIAILSVKIVRDVLLKNYGQKEGQQYQINGIPLSVEGAEELFSHDPRQFQNWAVEMAGGFSSTKHSGDLGIDGRVHFETRDGLRNMVLSVKGGKLTPAFIRELRGVLEREGNSEMGGLICLQHPTKGMLSEAATAGIYTYGGTEYHRLQIRTIQDLLDGNGFDTPSRVQTLSWVKQLALPL
jgi:DNA modification methylase